MIIIIENGNKWIGKTRILSWICVCVTAVTIFFIPTYSYVQKYVEFCLTGEYHTIIQKFASWKKNENVNQEDEILMVDLPSEYYLFIDKKPAYKYFTKQSHFSKGETSVLTACK